MKYLLVYSAGVVTAPIWLYVFRKPINQHIIVKLIANDRFDQPLSDFMMARNKVKKKAN